MQMRSIVFQVNGKPISITNREDQYKNIRDWDEDKRAQVGRIAEALLGPVQGHDPEARQAMLMAKAIKLGLEAQGGNIKKVEESAELALDIAIARTVHLPKLIFPGLTYPACRQSVVSLLGDLRAIEAREVLVRIVSQDSDARVVQAARIALEKIDQLQTTI